MNHEEKEVVFFRYVHSLADELSIISKYHQKHSTMLLMVLIDIVARIWDVFIGEKNTNNQKDRFTEWCNEFMSISSPPRINADNLYKLRCSLLHFGGIPKPFMFEEHYNSVCETQSFSEITKGIQVQIISTKLLVEFSKGVIKMMHAIGNKQDCLEYKNFINTMVRTIELEGSFLIRGD